MEENKESLRGEWNLIDLRDKPPPERVLLLFYGDRNNSSREAWFVGYFKQGVFWVSQKPEFKFDKPLPEYKPRFWMYLPETPVD